MAASPGGRRELHLVAYTDASTFGGAERCLATVLELLDSDIGVTVVGTSGPIVAEVAKRRSGARSVIVPAVPRKWHLRAIVAHSRAMRNLRPDVCHVNLRTPYACQYGLLAAALTPGARVVAVEHLPLHTDSPFRRWLKKATSRRLAAHIAVSDSTARAVEADAGLETGSITVIRNGVPEQPDGTSRERLASGPVVGSTGRIDHQKGIDLLVDALTLLPAATVVIVGDGAERVALEQRAERAGVGDRLIVTGWTDRVATLLRGFDVFVLASRFEGLPLGVLEAMEAGLPVVATNVGGVSEAVANGETGLLVPPEDPVSLAAGVGKLLADEELRRRLGRRGREVWAADFDAARMAEAYERLYRGLVR